MSSVEALKLEVSIVCLINRSEETFSTASNAAGLHRSSRSMAECIPCVLQILKAIADTQVQDAREYENTSDPDVKKRIEDRSQTVREAVESCLENIEEMQGIFKSIIPDDNNSRFQRYKLAIRSAALGKERKLQQLFTDILDTLKLLHIHRSMANQARLAELETVRKRVFDSPPPAYPGSPSLGFTSNDAEEEKEDASKWNKPPTTGPSMVFHNPPGSKIFCQGSQVFRDDPFSQFVGSTKKEDTSKRNKPPTTGPSMVFHNPPGSKIFCQGSQVFGDDPVSPFVGSTKKEETSKRNKPPTTGPSMEFHNFSGTTVHHQGDQVFYGELWTEVCLSGGETSDPH